MLTPEEELERVKKAVLVGRSVRGCFEWNDRCVQRVEKDRDLEGLTADEIRRLAIEYVGAGGTIRQAKEHRSEYSDYEFYYKIVMPVSELRRDLFVEMRLIDPDPDVPTVFIVNAHLQNK